MDAASILLAIVAAGVNFGWHPAEGAPDGYEYVVQIEPELLDVLRRGESVPIESNVPPDVSPIRKVSIVVGRGDVPRTSRDTVQRTAFFAEQTDETPDRYSAPPAAAATDWATIAWGSDATASPATISRDDTDTPPADMPPAVTPPADTAPEDDLVRVQPAQPVNPQPQEPPKTATNWEDLWGDDDPWADSQSPPAATPAEPPPADAVANGVHSHSAPSNVVQLGTMPSERSPSSQTPTNDQPPWLPLLAVSVALAGSLGANLFLGWSYLDARQKYRSLVRRTADKFRRAATVTP